jgi:hypothetical protein
LARASAVIDAVGSGEHSDARPLSLELMGFKEGKPADGSSAKLRKEDL